jgi:hypothetical protein
MANPLMEQYLPANWTTPDKPRQNRLSNSSDLQIHTWPREVRDIYLKHVQDEGGNAMSPEQWASKNNNYFKGTSDGLRRSQYE